MNRGVQLSGDTLNLSLESWLPESSLNQYRLGNCAEVDAVNQALNSGANASDLYLYTINTKNNVSKPVCENCIYIFGDRVAIQSMQIFEFFFCNIFRILHSIF